MSFTAKYEGRCGGCGTKISLGDECDRERGRTVHTGCGTASYNRNGWDDPADRDNDDDADDEQPTVTGQRDHTRRCPDCHTVHAGECW